MPYLINPGGRYVAVTDEMFDKLSIEPGFTIPNEQEVKEHIRLKMQLIDEMTNPVDDTERGVYMATVSQGGKDGYSVASRNMVDALKKLDIPVSFHNTGQKIALLFHNPYSILRLEAPYRILYTMFESDKIPADWHDYLEAADKILVPSKWCRDVFDNAGFKTEVVPLGYDDKLFTYKKRPNKRKLRKDFVFLHYNAFNVRKGFLEVFKAFNKAFAKDEPVKMIYKTTLNHIPLPITKQQYPNIEIINAKYSDKELLDLIYRSDCFVFPSRGEGFGMTPLECMATGIPAIVPNAHGISEYFDERYMYEAKLDKDEPYCPALYSRYKDQDVGRMVVCDVDQLAEQMRYIYEHQEEAAEKGRLASEYVKNWTWDKTAEKLKVIFDATAKMKLEDKPLKNTLNLELIR